MKFTNEQLQNVLNYDSHGTKCFSDFERIAIHRAISYRLTYSTFGEVETKLAAKINNTLTKMAVERYELVDITYIEDKKGNIQIK